MNLNPKDRFQKNKPLNDWHKRILGEDELFGALETSLAEMELSMPQVVNPAQDVTTASQMAGAKKFISHFLNLSVPGQISKPADPTKLNYNV